MAHGPLSFAATKQDQGVSPNPRTVAQSPGALSRLGGKRLALLSATLCQAASTAPDISWAYGLQCVEAEVRVVPVEEGGGRDGAAAMLQLNVGSSAFPFTDTPNCHVVCVESSDRN